MKKTLAAILICFPSLKLLIKSVFNYLFPSAKVSSDYVCLEGRQCDIQVKRLRTAWQDESLPARQREFVDRQIRKFRSGACVDVFDVFIKCIRDIEDLVPNMSLLEIGCSSGFYSEVIEIAKLQINYTGCDYSAAFIELARKKYPSINFSVDDATSLDYPDCSFDIVVSGCCLLHIPDYEKAISETVRVARRYTIFHRTPVVWGQNEQWYRKQAYGVETVEIHFNEQNFLELLVRNGLVLFAIHTLHEESSCIDGSKGSAVRSYVCRKET